MPCIDASINPSILGVSFQMGHMDQIYESPCHVLSVLYKIGDINRPYYVPVRMKYSHPCPLLKLPLWIQPSRSGSLYCVVLYGGSYRNHSLLTKQVCKWLLLCACVELSDSRGLWAVNAVGLFYGGFDDGWRGESDYLCLCISALEVPLQHLKL